MIAIVDYGIGNLFSLVSSFKAISVPVTVTSDPDIIVKSDKIVLPGVGAFGDAADKLRSAGLVDLLLSEAEKKPFLGICLGMQLLFEKSCEYGEHKGLGLIKGEIKGFDLPKEYKVPHMGWNALRIRKESPLLKYVKDGDYVYYVHSYYADGDADCCYASSGYGVEVAGLVQEGNVFGTQFHPEKSGEVGLNILKAFAEVKL